MNAFIVCLACAVIFMNTVPRVNDVQLHFEKNSVRKWIRFIGLLLTAGSSLWLGINVLVPTRPHDDAAALLMAGIAMTWSCSPVVGSWWGYTFRRGGEDRYKLLKRRSTDKEHMA